MLKKNKIQPVILSGGSGTRLWPLSREKFPKQYIQLNSKSSYSFLQKTQLRLSGLENLEDPIIICNEEHRFIVAEQMREIKIKPKSIILEPFGRNTASAIAIASLQSSKYDKNSILLILSADHEIINSSEFQLAIKKGIQDANEEKLVTFGVRPKSPETGYGYIEFEPTNYCSSNKSYRINRFIEKPNLEKAKEIFKKDNYLWNSGIFLFKAKSILGELNKFEPKLLSECKKSLFKASKDLDFIRLYEENFRNCPKISIDVAVMEQTDKARVIPLSAGWSDIGNWTSLWNLEDKDKRGNTLIGDIYAKNVSNSYLRSENNLLVVIGFENMIVVQTEDSVLIANMNQSQEIKNIVNKLNQEGRTEIKSHRKVFRPWGYYKLIDRGPTWQVKEICVNPKSSLSLQKHNYRSEHWIILKGIANIEINNEKKVLIEKQSTYIPLGAKHRLSNNEETALTIIEVQNGEYLGEDDIFRYEDNYGRIN